MGDFNWGILIPLMAIGFPFLIAIIAILTNHQKQMARLVRGMPEEDEDTLGAVTAHKERMAYAMRGMEDPEKVAALESRVAELEGRVNELTLALDSQRAPILTNRENENAL